MASLRARGFTLIEMVATLVIIAVIAALAAPGALAALGAHQASRAEVETLDKLRYAIERMAREIREVKRDFTLGYLIDMSTSGPIFTKYGPTYAVTDPVVTISQGSNVVRLKYSSPAFTTAPILTDQLSSLTFAYFDAAGSSTTSATDVRYVEISLTLTQGTHTFSERVRVGLRNQ